LRTHAPRQLQKQHDTELFDAILAPNDGIAGIPICVWPKTDPPYEPDALCKQRLAIIRGSLSEVLIRGICTKAAIQDSDPYQIKSAVRPHQNYFSQNQQTI